MFRYALVIALAASYLSVPSTCIAQFVPAGSPEPHAPMPVSKAGGEWEISLRDGGTMTADLLSEHLTLTTPYGRLQVPLKDIWRIEFGDLLSGAEQSALQSALANAASDDPAKRPDGKTALIGMGQKAIPAIRRALRTSKPDCMQHLEQVLSALEAQLDAPDAELRDMDAIHTHNSIMSGQLDMTVLRIRSVQFGELDLKARDAKRLILRSAKEPGAGLEIVEAGSLRSLLHTHIGKSVRVRVTGRMGGTVWGSGPYTGDSDIGAAALHAGAVRMGETRLVKIKILPSPASFSGSTANGVTTRSYGAFPSGAFEISKRYLIGSE